MTLCENWITGEDVATCCDVQASDSTEFDFAAEQAQELLFELSGRRFNGICEQTVRPCWTACACGWQVLSRGHIVWNPNYDWGWGGWYGSWMCDGDQCGCVPVSKVPLAGYVQEIVEVVIDGAVVDPATYRVDRHRWLVRQRTDPDDVNTAAWPGCQIMDLPPGQPGTWSVTYLYGVDVPASGIAAAIELACEIFKACNGDECKLPAGTQRVNRQGVTIEKVPFTQWGWTTGKRAGQVKGWNTGLAAVDVFLNAYNPSGLLRVPVIWSPNSQLRFPIPVTAAGT